MTATTASTLAARLYGAMKAKGSKVTLERRTTSLGRAPQVNPPENAELLLVDGSFAAGATAIALRAAGGLLPPPRGQFLPGDSLLVGGLVLAVQAPAAAQSPPTTSPGFPVVHVAPLLAALSDGDQVLPSFAARTVTYGMPSRVSSQLVNGQDVKVGDLAVLVPNFKLAMPQTGDRIGFGGLWYLVGFVVPNLVRGEPVSWLVQARSG